MSHSKVKYINYLFIFILLFSTACKKQIKLTEKDDEITTFFKACENDITKAAQVISEKELIKILTHLQYMDVGGKKYYPLERKAITKMINSLISFNYSDCILANNKGTIVYTMYNDNIFSKNAKHISDSPFKDIFEAAMKNEPIIVDVTRFPLLSNNFDIFFSKPIIRNNKIFGVLIASININQIIPLLSKNSYIVDKEGSFKIHADPNLIFSKDENFFKKDQRNRYIPFKYKNINWFLYK
jgi:hypothetical protein